MGPDAEEQTSKSNLKLVPNRVSAAAKHAVLILAHDNPAQLELLLESVAHPRLDPFLHLDAESNDTFEKARRLAAETIQRYDIRWGGYRMVRATLDLLALARARATYDTFTLLSGRDYPVRPTDEVVAWLDSIEVSRIGHWHNEDPSWHRRWNRYFFHDWAWPWGRIANAASRRLAAACPDRAWPVTPYFGSQWWTLTRRDVDRAFDFIEKRPDVVRFMRYVHIPDECFFQTLLCNHPDVGRLSRKKRRYIDWSEGNAHPKILEKEDIPDVLASGAAFARKLDIHEAPGAVQCLENHRAIKTC